MQLEKILNLYTKEEQEFLKKVKKVKNIAEHTTESRGGMMQTGEKMSDRYSFLPTAKEFSEHIEQTLKGILNDD